MGLVPCPTFNLEDQGLPSSGPCPLMCLAWVTLLGAYAPTNIALHMIRAWKPCYNSKVVAKQEAILLFVFLSVQDSAPIHCLVCSGASFCSSVVLGSYF